MRQIFTAIGEDRMYSTKLALGKYFSDDMEKKTDSVTQKMNIGKDGCSVLDLHWVPDSLKSTGSPENLMGFGAPHMHMFTTGSRKVGPEDIPFWGFSQFVVGITGACWLVSWPASYATDLSMKVEQLFDIVAHQKKEVFTSFFKNTAFHCLVKKDTVAWIPCGHCYTLIPLQGQERDLTVALTIPYMNVKLMQAADPVPLRAVRDVLQRHSTSDFIVDKAPKLKPALDQFLQWLKDIIAVGDDKEMEDEQDRSEAETQPALVPSTQATEAADGSPASAVA